MTAAPDDDAERWAIHDGEIDPRPEDASRRNG